MPNRTDQQLGARIAALRKERSVSQRVLAEQMDIDQSALSRIETGDRGLAAAEVLAIADFFGISVDELLRAGHQEPFARYADKRDADLQPAISAMRKIIDDALMLETVVG